MGRQGSACHQSAQLHSKSFVSTVLGTRVDGVLPRLASHPITAIASLMSGVMHTARELMVFPQITCMVVIYVEIHCNFIA